MPKTIIIRIDASSDPRYGCLPEKRTINDLLQYGFIILNKPCGPTSHQVTDWAKKILHIAKAGHSGTLDPHVTGVLVVTLGKATRIADVLLRSGKEYVSILHLHEPVSEENIRTAFQKFCGTVEQLPPKRSAVKRQLRKRTIYSIQILEIDDRDVLFRVGCQAGTYIRKLCVDIALELGVKGHMHELIRTKVAQFADSEWVSLQDIADAYAFWKEEGNEKKLREIIHPVEKAIETLPHIWVLDSAVDSVCHGAFLTVPGIAKLHSDISVGDLVVVMTLKDELVGLGVAAMNAQNIARQKQGVAVKNTRIFMERGTYPRFERG